MNGSHPEHRQDSLEQHTAYTQIRGDKDGKRGNGIGKGRGMKNVVRGRVNAYLVSQVGNATPLARCWSIDIVNTDVL
jgi:hypothetical protein